jgi:phosphatidylglycerol lysyltransferase
MAYLSLENDKKYFFGSQVNGVCSYQVAANVFVVCGDMICSEKDGFSFLGEIIHYCKQNGYTMLFLNVTDTFLKLYKMANFGVLKYGEDACFDLESYNLTGGKVAKVRAAINHATKSGITVHEYKPLVQKDIKIEEQIQDISKEWLENKKSDEMGFMLGGMGLSDPLDRRYFYAVNDEGYMYGFVVFLPYMTQKAYLADVTRRRTKAPQGILEKIIYEGFMVFKEEGAKWGNMGLSPLYHIAEGDHSTMSAKLFDYIYEHMDQGYDFKALHHAKEKYAPTHWIPRYIAYNPMPFTPTLAYAMVRVQMKKGLLKMAFSEFRKKEVDSNETKD